MRQFQFLATGVLICAACAAPIAAAEELPPCDPTLRPTEFKGVIELSRDCRLEGRVTVSFTIKVNGRTTNIVIESFRAGEHRRADYCVSDYARAYIRGSRFPARDQACQHVMTIDFTGKTHLERNGSAR
jgi:hypothetical protein